MPEEPRRGDRDDTARTTQPAVTGNAAPAPALASVPNADGEEGHAPDRAPIARWSVALSEPLLSTPARVEADAQMTRFIRRNPDWAATWFAGVTHDVLSTLPDDDPWRTVTGAVDLHALETGQAGPAENLLVAQRYGQPTPPTTGALTADGRPFGVLDNATDLVLADLGDPDLDVGLAAVAEPLTPLAAALVAFAAGEVRSAVRTYRDVYHALWLGRFAAVDDRNPAEAFLAAAASALRWSLHRRRTYTGHEDPFPTVAAFAWMAKTDRIRSGGAIGDEVGLAESARIDADAYRAMRDFQ